MDDQPLPVPNADTKPFWDGCALGELRVQRCVACGHAQFPPRAFCGACRGGVPAWEAASGRARILSHTRVHRGPSAFFKAQGPYVVALVALEEGPHIMLQLRGTAVEAPRIGAAVRIAFDPPAGPHGIALPHAVAAEG
jgi:uncharacterized protein